MSESENPVKNEEMGKKENNPLSVRIDHDYREIFEELIKQKGISKKALLEAMITNYIDCDDKNGEHLNCNFELSLISNSLNEIFDTFKTISKKAQNTIGSQKDYFEQQINNLNIKAQTFENKVTEFSEKNKLLEIANSGYTVEKASLLKSINDLDNAFKAKEKEIQNFNMKNSELLEQINIMRKVEKDNIILRNENKELINENRKIKAKLDDKVSEIERLKSRLNDLNIEINSLKSRKKEEISEIESRIMKEFEIDKKTAILQLQIQYNQLQSENIKNIGIINEKSEEIILLKRNLEVISAK